MTVDPELVDDLARLQQELKEYAIGMVFSAIEYSGPEPELRLTFGDGTVLVIGIDAKTNSFTLQLCPRLT